MRSCGASSGGKLDGFSVSAMEELGLDISDHTPCTYRDLEDSNFDLVITLSPAAQHHATEMTRTEAVDIEYWPTYDPTTEQGSRNQKLAAYREVRDQLDANIKRRFAEWMTR